MKYTKFKQEQEKKYNEFPFMYAFNSKQLNEGMKKLNVKNADELYSIGGGGFIRKKDDKAFQDLINTVEKEIEEFLKDDDQLLDALKYELGNHEYCISYDYEPVLEALGLPRYQDLTGRQKEILNKAKKQYLANCNN
jgi:hypothetical protein